MAYYSVNQLSYYFNVHPLLDKIMDPNSKYFLIKLDFKIPPFIVYKNIGAFKLDFQSFRKIYNL